MRQPEKRFPDAAVAQCLDAARKPKAKPRRWLLLILEGPRKGQQFRLPKRGTVRLGRAIDNLIRFDRDDEHGISQHHAELRIDAESLAIADLDSTNGVFVNGERIQEGASLAEGDGVELGRGVVRMMVVRV